MLIRKAWLPSAQAGFYRCLEFEPGTFVLARKWPDTHMMRLYRVLLDQPTLIPYIEELAVQSHSLDLLVAFRALLFALMPTLHRLSLAPCPRNYIIFSPTLTMLIIRHDDCPLPLNAIGDCPNLETLEIEVADFEGGLVNPAPLLPGLRKLAIRYQPSPSTASHPHVAFNAIAAFLPRVPACLTLLKLILICDDGASLNQPASNDGYHVRLALCSLMKSAGQATQGGHVRLDAPFIWEWLSPAVLGMSRAFAGVDQLTVRHLRARAFTIDALPLGLTALRLDWVHGIVDPYSWWLDTVADILARLPGLCKLFIKASLQGSWPWTEFDQERLEHELENLARTLQQDRGIEADFFTSVE